jgi:T5SS/PEP-CTERM-associated repeat protein
MRNNAVLTVSGKYIQQRAAFIAWTATLAAAGMIFAVATASAQVTPGGSVTNIVGSPNGATQNVTAPSTVGDTAAGTLSISGAGTTLNMFDGVTPDAFLRVGNGGTGRAVINDFGTLNLTATNPTSDDAFLFISATPFNSGPSQNGTLVMGDDPNTGAVENTGFMSLTARDDAVVSVGRNGVGDLLMTNSSMTVTSLGSAVGAAALIELGASTVGNAVGSFTATNSNILVEGQGVAASLVSVGRRTNTVTNPNPATAPENTLLLQGGSSLRVIADTGTSFFNVGRDGSRGTATIDGGATSLEVEDFIYVGRNGGVGTLNVRNGADVDNFTAGSVSETRVGAEVGTGTLNIESGGTYATRTLAIAEGAGSNGTVNIDGAGSTLTQNADGPVTTLVGQTGVGQLNVTGGGSLVVNDPTKTSQFLAGVDAGSNGTVSVDGAGSSIDAGPDARIGVAGTGALDVTNGGAFNSTRLFGSVLLGSSSSISVDGTGSNIDLRGTDEFGNGPIALIGLAGTSTLDVKNGATVNIDNNGEAITTTLRGGLLIGGTSTSPTGNGTVNIDGAGSAMDIATSDASMQVGRNGTGELNITGGGKLTNSAGDGLAIVGRTAVSTGTVLVSGTGSEWQAGNQLVVGSEVDLSTRALLAGGGSGSITVEDSGTLSSRNIFIQNGDMEINSGGTATGRLAILGNDTGGTGELTVSGLGSRMDLTGKNSSGSRAALVIGDEGAGTLNINNGGVVEVNGDLEPGRGSVINLGGSLNTTQATGNGIANVDGAGSELRLSSGEVALFQVGRFGNGTLNVTNGGSVVVVDPDKQAQFRIGRVSTATGVVNVDGVGSSVDAGRSTRVGISGNGTLNVTNGGTFESTEFATASGTGSTGNVNVSGPGSTLNLLGVDGQGDAAVALVGLNGQSVVNINNGGTMNIDANGETVTGLNGGLLVGGSSTSTDQGDGTLNVDGVGSTVNIVHSGASTQIGRRGTGTMNVTNGGKVTNAAGDALAIVGRTATSTGTVNITGAGSEWRAGSDLFIGTDVNFGTRTAIGNGGDGTVNVANGGRLVADRIVNAERGRITGGGGTIVGNLANAGGTIAAGNSPGLMSVIGNVDLLGGGTVEIELGGTTFDSGIPQFDCDRIDVADNVATTGTAEGIVTIDTGALFDIDFFGAFTAGLGDTFDVIVADDIDVADLSSLIFDFADAALMTGLLWEIDIVSFGLGREALQLMVVAEAVSEPGAALILIGGLGVLVSVRRRRRHG